MNYQRKMLCAKNGFRLFWTPALNSNCSVVCSFHFPGCDFKESCRIRQRLKPEAVLSLFGESISQTSDAEWARAGKRKRDSSSTGFLNAKNSARSRATPPPRNTPTSTLLTRHLVRQLSQAAA
ncbi:hypothetical protein HPB50_009181 [Hyalomma asiaticum]|uniref:Uncharacterized protein n=1 Tax=Hyalomma asiaticum TaxID=266040 RepID=A0ACB7T0K6_HYAAI|nr:hypothetical protein HPB50_009181 [Hyalomma asiaticum]